MINVNSYLTSPSQNCSQTYSALFEKSLELHKSVWKKVRNRCRQSDHLIYFSGVWNICKIKCTTTSALFLFIYFQYVFFLSKKIVKKSLKLCEYKDDAGDIGNTVGCKTNRIPTSIAIKLFIWWQCTLPAYRIHSDQTTNAKLYSTICHLHCTMHTYWNV